MGKWPVSTKISIRRWHSWHIILIAVTAFVGCGGSTSPGGSGANPPCSACAPDSYTCVVTGAESATLSITSRTATGCSGTLQAYNKAELTCDTSTICYAGKCVPFTEDKGGLHFSIGSSPAICFPN